jgi:tetratricopeptide (TPR) repeat protein
VRRNPQLAPAIARTPDRSPKIRAMRRLNSRLFLLLVVAIAVGALIIQGLHAFQVGRQSSAFLREADRAEEAGSPQEAAGFLRTYLRLVPEDTRTMERLATLLFNHRQYGEARELFGQLILRDQNNEEARRRLVDTSIRSERYQDALYHLGFLLKSHPDDGDLWLQFGAAQEGLGQLQPAVEALGTAITKSPGLLAAYEASARIFADHLGDGPAAIAILGKMVNQKENRAKSEAYIVRARFVRSHVEDRSVRESIRKAGAKSGASAPAGNDLAATQEAVQRAFADDVKEALRLAPNNSQVLLLAAQASLANGSAKEANEYAERALRQDPSNAECYLVQASIHLHEKRSSDAVECLTRGLQATDGAPVLLWTLANLCLEDNKIQEAKALLERLRPIEAARPIVRYFAARIQITESKWAEATRELEGVEGELKRWPQMYKDAQLRLAQCYSRLGRDDWAVGAYRAALQIDADWTPARLRLADLLRSLGRTDEAIVELRRLRQRPDAPPQADQELLRLTIHKTLALPPNERNWTAIDAALSELLKKPFAVEIALLRAEVELGKDHSDEAARTLRAALEKAPKDVRLWTALTSLTGRREHWDETEQLLGEMKQRLGDSVTLRLARAAYLIRRYGGSRKEELRSLADPPSASSASDKLDLSFPLGRMAVSIQDYDLAQRMWQRVADGEPANLQIRLMLIDLAWQREKPEDLAKPLAEIELLEQNGPYSHYGKALQSAGLARQLKDEAVRKPDKALAARSDALFDKAIEELGEAGSRFPSWSKIPLASAQIAEIRGKGDAALESYRATFDLGERSPFVVNRLLTLLVDRQENDKIEAVVRELIDEKVPFSSELTSVVSEALVQMGDRQGALALAQKSAASSKDIRSAILLGQLLRVNGQPDAAEAEFQRATRLAPKDVSPWLALIAFYSSGGKSGSAEKTLKQALTAIDPQQAWEVAGYAYQLAGKLQEAEKTYDAALKANSGRFQIRKLAVETKLQNRHVGQAVALLQEYLATAETSGEPVNVAWSRRSLALSLAGAGTYPGYTQALALINKNLQSPSASDADRRVEGMIQASFPTADSRDKALDALRKLAERPRVLSLDDRIVMARLFLSRGEWVQSSQVFREVVAKSKDPRHLAAYIDALLGQQELAGADDWLRRLEALAPRDFVTADLRARLLARQGRYSEAFDRIVGTLGEPASGKPANVALRRAASLRLEEFANDMTRLNRKADAQRFLAKAETLIIGKDVSGNDKAAETTSVDHLQFLVRCGRGPEALAEFDRLSLVGSAAERDQACMALTTWQLTNPEQLQRLERSLARVAQRWPTYSAWVALAAIQDRLERFDDEEASYRRALALDDGTRIDALNNLAYLLALRRKDLNEAQTLVNKAIALAGPRTSLLDSRALIELAAGKPDAALADLETAVNDGASAVHLFHLARVRMVNGQPDDARASMRKALDRGLTEASLNRLEASAFQELRAQLQPARG